MIPLSRGKIGITIALAVVSAVALPSIVMFEGLQSEQRREGAPSAGEVQTAYDRAAATAGGSHDADLKVVQVDCRRSEGLRYSCRVDFVKTAADPVRLFLDLAVVERRSPNGWILLRGLCRHLS
jgi:hypothetical protein